MPPNENRTDQVVCYLLERAGRPVLKTQLLKLVYLADLESRKYFGHPISGLRYVRWHFGPFDEKFYRSLERLELAGSVQAREQTYGDFEGTEYMPGAGASDTWQPSIEERAVLDYVLRKYAPLDTRALLEHVYATPPMREPSAQTKGRPLNMSAVDATATQALGGFDFESLKLAREQFERGEEIEWDDFERELLGNTRPGCS